MARNAQSIAIRDTHRREYKRTMRLVLSGSVILWFVMAVLLAGNHAGSVIVPMSFLLLVAVAGARVFFWTRYRRDVKVELMAHELAQQGDEG